MMQFPPNFGFNERVWVIPTRISGLNASGSIVLVWAAIRDHVVTKTKLFVTLPELRCHPEVFLLPPSRDESPFARHY